MRKLAHLLLAAGILAGSLLTISTPAQASSDKIDICHATGKDGKYVAQSVAKDGTANGHAGASHQDGQDIIPAYSWIDNGVRYYFDGQNLEKGADLLANGCKVPAMPVTAVPVAPVYVPATCAAPSHPFGRVVVPDDLGTGVASAATPAINNANTEWSVAYTLATDTEDQTYSWPAGQDGTYRFDVVPLSADPMYVVDSKTGNGQCEMPDTGASAWMIPATALGLSAILAGAVMAFRRRRNA